MLPLDYHHRFAGVPQIAGITYKCKDCGLTAHFVDDDWRFWSLDRSQYWDTKEEPGFPIHCPTLRGLVKEVMRRKKLKLKI